MDRVLFSSLTNHWGTPESVYRELDREFHFNDDPCPLYGSGGLDREWGTRTYVNPPYGRQVGHWIKKAYDESLKGKIIVCLVASRTDTKWWHDYIMRAKEIRFIKGRLRFQGAVHHAPFPSAIVVFN